MGRTKQTRRETARSNAKLFGTKAARSTTSAPKKNAPKGNRPTPRAPKHEKPAKGDYDAKLPRLSVHSPEARLPHGRVLHSWSLCMKPKSESNGGCRTGYFGYFVYHQGVLRKAMKCGTDVCDWIPGDGEEDDEEDEDEEMEDAEEDAGRDDVQEQGGEQQGGMEVDQGSSELEEGEFREESSELEEREIREY